VDPELDGFSVGGWFAGGYFTGGGVSERILHNFLIYFFFLLFVVAFCELLVFLYCYV